MELDKYSKETKLQWIAEGKYLDELSNDPSKFIRIKVRSKRIELDEEELRKEREKSFSERIEKTGADIFEVIVLEAKTPDEVYELIANDEYLKYFSEHNNISYRLRAKMRLSDLKKREKYATIDSIYSNRRHIGKKYGNSI